MPKGTVSTEKLKIYAPIAGKPSEIGGVFGEDRGDHIHAGLDVDCPVGTPCIAPVDGRIVNFAQDHDFAPGEGAQGGGGMIQFEFLQNVGPISKGDVIGWGHVFAVFAKVGQTVRAGQKIATSGETTFNHAPHVHFIYQHPNNGDMDGSSDPAPVYDYLRTEGRDTSGFASRPPDGPIQVGETSAAEVAAISKGAAIAAFINLPGLLDNALSLSLKGERSLMNDKPLLPFVEQLCQGSLRNFASLPNGNFYAFIPDYFGGLTGREAYWQIHDIEILSGEIQLSDEALATHVYVVGDTATIDQSIDVFEKIQTSGVITIFNAFMADFLNGVNDPTVTQEGKPKPLATQQYNQEIEKVPSLAEKSKAVAFLEKYGARPYYEEAPMIRSHYFETFLAYQLFCLLWSKQFLTTFEFTFMPELFPGGLVQFPEHGIQCYIDEVQHSGDYEGGFRTIAALSAPTALSNGNKEINSGMIRANIFNPAVIANGGSQGNDGQSRQKHH